MKDVAPPIELSFYDAVTKLVIPMLDVALPFDVRLTERDNQSSNNLHIEFLIPGTERRIASSLLGVKQGNKYNVSLYPSNNDWLKVVRCEESDYNSADRMRVEVGGTLNVAWRRAEHYYEVPHVKVDDIAKLVPVLQRRIFSMDTLNKFVENEVKAEAEQAKWQKLYDSVCLYVVEHEFVQIPHRLYTYARKIEPYQIEFKYHASDNANGGRERSEWPVPVPYTSMIVQVAVEYINPEERNRVLRVWFDGRVTSDGRFTGEMHVPTSVLFSSHYANMLDTMNRYLSTLNDRLREATAVADPDGN